MRGGGPQRFLVHLGRLPPQLVSLRTLRGGLRLLEYLVGVAVGRILQHGFHEIALRLLLLEACHRARTLLLGFRKSARSVSVVLHVAHDEQAFPSFVTESILLTLLFVDNLESIAGLLEMTVKIILLRGIKRILESAPLLVALGGHALDVFVTCLHRLLNHSRNVVHHYCLAAFRPFQFRLFSKLDPLAPAGILPPLKREIAIDVCQIDHKKARVVDELIVLVGVTNVDRGLFRSGDLLRCWFRVLLRIESMKRDLEANLVVECVGVEVPTLVRIRRVFVLFQKAGPTDRCEPVLLKGKVRQSPLLLGVAGLVGLLKRRLAVARVRDRGALEPRAHKLLGALQSRGVVLVSIHPRRVAHVFGESRAGLEYLSLVLAPVVTHFGPAHEQVVDLGHRALRIWGRCVHWPLVEHYLIRSQRIVVLIYGAKLERQRLVDFNRPRLVLRNEPRVLNAIKCNPQLGLGLARTPRRVENIGPRNVRLLRGRPGKVKVVQGAGDVRVRLLTEVGARISG